MCFSLPCNEPFRLPIDFGLPTFPRILNYERVNISLLLKTAKCGERKEDGWPSVPQQKEREDVQKKVTGRSQQSIREFQREISRKSNSIEILDRRLDDRMSTNRLCCDS
jgi:hypothetical protein